MNALETLMKAMEHSQQRNTQTHNFVPYFRGFLEPQKPVLGSQIQSQFQSQKNKWRSYMTSVTFMSLTFHLSTENKE